jgi:solute carrier family 13 (sodium-dependent dicarboxylate transporter), member 2/3/5
MASGYGFDMATVGFVAALCVIWWVFEPVPIPATSLLPLAILPLLGVLSPEEVGQAYGSPPILLLLRGFLLTKPMEHSGAYRRLAIGMMGVFGVSSGRRLMLVPAVMSASFAFMLPVGTAPNTIIFGSGLITTARMAREGLLVNLLGVAVISSVCYIVLSRAGGLVIARLEQGHHGFGRAYVHTGAGFHV